MSRELTITVGESDDGRTAQDMLRSRGFSRRMLTKLKQTGGLKRGGEILRSIDRVRAGDVVCVVMSDSADIPPDPDIPAPVAYEDEDIVVFDKPPFLPVHQSIGHYSGTLANLFAALYPELPFRPINRLDKNTSGLCVCAKNRFAAASVSGNISKVYFAAVDGDIARGGVIDLPIDRESGSIIRRCVSPTGKRAVTHYEPVLRENGRTLLRIMLETGRTHQIRVHFSHIGFPLCGDDMYGGDCSRINRQALHCGEVSFDLPFTGERITAGSELPDDIRSLFSGKG